MKWHDEWIVSGPRPLTFSDYAACAEAGVLLGFFHFAVHFLPFRVIAPAVGAPVVEAPADGQAGAASTASLSPEQLGHAIRIQWAVQRMARAAPFVPMCLARSLAARVMLRHRGVPATLYFGLRRRGVPPGQDRKTGAIAAHAWLTTGPIAVVGGDGGSNIPVGRFS